MKYLESTLICSLNEPCISPRSVRIIKWTGIVCYVLAMIVMWIWDLATWPGYVNDDSLDQYSKWWNTTYTQVYRATNLLWLTITFASMAVTIFAII
jgi:hypothetical protein